MTNRKGIILAGGSGTRLLPDHTGSIKATHTCLRQANDLLSAQCIDAGGDSRSTYHLDSADTPRFAQLLGDGSQWG